MLFNAPSNPTTTKHVIYLAASTLLGVLLSIIVHIIAETLYLNWAAAHDKAITWHWHCALHPVMQISLLMLGAVGGFAIGRIWWQWVYIDRRWAKGIINTTKPTS